MNSVDQYISTFPPDVQAILSNIRELIKQQAPEVDESLAYGMPAYKTNGRPLVYFAAFEKHIGFYATPSGHTRFSEELSQYKQGKGSVQFPLNNPIPYELIRRIVEYRVVENSLLTKKK
jgi:uncharacterized protein YdhG (YjbR/CyaY superfamily)